LVVAFLLFIIFRKKFMKEVNEIYFCHFQWFISALMRRIFSYSPQFLRRITC
jgi:hypothetical protein